MTSAARVCLSYQAADAGAVIDRLVAALAVGFEVVRAPDPADHVETDPLDGCDALLLVVGPDWHDREEEQDDLGVSLLEQAADHALPVVVVLLEATPPPDLGDLATVRLREEAYAHDIAELFQTVERLTSPQPSPEPEEPEERALDENVQFTVYRPRAVRPAEWYDLLAFAHLAERRPDAPPDEPDPLAQVKAQAEQLLGARLGDYDDPRSDSRFGVPQDGEITFLPEIPGVTFNPERRVFRWQEDVHREEFRLRADPEVNGRTVRGRLRVYLGMIILAEVDLALRVDAAAPPATVPGPPAAPDHARPYRKIFASYSHADLEVVRQFELMAQALGDDYLRDLARLRAGDDWDEELLRLIDGADVFQLFWSYNSMRSPHVRREWEYAQSLARPHFIRPTYWEEPLPSSDQPPLPPDSLRRLHFSRLSALPPATPPPSAPAMSVAPSPSPAQFATPEAAPPRKRVRFRALVAPLALAVLGATALSGVLLSGGGDGSPIAGPPAKPAGVSRPPSTTSRPAATATSASPTAEPSAAPTADTSASPQLLRRLPVAIAKTCEAFPISKDSTYAEGLVRAVQCQPTGADAPADVWYLQYADADAMSAAFAEVTGSTRYVDGDCTAPGQQFAYVTDEAPGRVAGRLRCYGGQDVSGLAWTHDRLRILSVTEAEGTDLASLVQWWSTAGPYLEPHPGSESEPV